MKRRFFLKTSTIGAAGLGLTLPSWAQLTPLKMDSERTDHSIHSIKTVLSFATEVAWAAEDYDFIKAIAQFLSEEKLTGNFHLTGDYARALKRRGQRDVVEALKPHEIGFHCNHHGARPFMGGYLEDNTWEEGLARWLVNESAGAALVAELVGRYPTYYTSEFSKAPQTVYGSGLLGMEITGYLPIPTRGHGAAWFCNGFVPSAENAIGLESFDRPGDQERLARDQFQKVSAKLSVEKAPLLRVFLHSYKYYVASPRDRLSPAVTPTDGVYRNDNLYYEDYPTDYVRYSKEQVRASFEMFKRTIRYYARSTDFVTFSEYRDVYRKNSETWIDLQELDRLVEFLTQALDAYLTATLSVSPAEAFGILVRVLRVWHETSQLPPKVFMRNIIGPRELIPDGLAVRSVRREDLLALMREVDRGLDTERAVPATVSVAGTLIGPGQLLSGLVGVYREIRSSKSLEQVSLSGESLPRIAKEPFFRENVFSRPQLYPVGFTGEKISGLCRMQAWSWKPAVKADGKSI